MNNIRIRRRKASKEEEEYEKRPLRQRTIIMDYQQAGKTLCQSHYHISYLMVFYPLL